MATSLITGGAGFIGSNIAKALVARSEQVVIFDNFLTGKRENLKDFAKQITLIEGDIRDREQLEQAMRGVDFVLHQAALPSVPRSVEDPLLTNAINVLGMLNVLLAARDAGVKRVVFASSSSVYGDTEVLPKVEHMVPNPMSPYAVSKFTGELLCRNFTDRYGLETVSLRYFNIFGPLQDPQSDYAAVIPRFITALLAGKPPVICGDGEQGRDFTFVENVVAANILSCTAKKAVGEVINIGCGERYTLNALCAELQRIIGTKVSARHTEPRSGDIRQSQADITKAKELIGYRPVVSFAEGLRRTVGWFSREAQGTAKG